MPAEAPTERRTDWASRGTEVLLLEQTDRPRLCSPQRSDCTSFSLIRLWWGPSGGPASAPQGKAAGQQVKTHPHSPHSGMSVTVGKAWGAREGQHGDSPVTSPLREGVLFSPTRTMAHVKPLLAADSQGWTGAAGCLGVGRAAGYLNAKVARKSRPLADGHQPRWDFGPERAGCAPRVCPCFQGSSDAPCELDQAQGRLAHRWSLCPGRTGPARHQPAGELQPCSWNASPGEAQGRPRGDTGGAGGRPPVATGGFTPGAW